MQDELIQAMAESLKQSGVVGDICKFDGTTIRTRCPICGDSDNKKHHHFGIRVIRVNLEKSFSEQKDIMAWFCHRHQKGGFVSPKLIQILTKSPTDSLIRLAHWNVRNLDGPITRLKSGKIDVPPSNPSQYPPEMYSGEAADAAYRYLQERTGKVITPEICKELSIIPDPKLFIKLTRSRLKYSDIILNQINHAIFGIIGYTRLGITFRNKDRKAPSRFNRYITISQDGYDGGIPAGFLYYPVTPIGYFNYTGKGVKVLLVEGVVDFISMYLNPEVFDNPDIIIKSGKSYNTGMNFVKWYLGLTNASFTIGANTDDLSRLTHMKRECLFAEKPRIFYNTNGGDFGVPANKIVKAML